MAEVDTNMLSQEHADIRRENAEHTAEIRFNVAERAGDIRREVAVSTDTLNDAIRVEGGRTREVGAMQAGEIVKEGLKAQDRISSQSAAETTEIIKEGMKGTHEVFSAVRDNRYDLASRIENAADRTERGVTEMRGNVADRFFAIGRDVAELRAGQVAAMKDVELNALKTQIEGQRNTTYLSDKITMEGEKTRGLINDLKYHDLNRGLVERNAALVEAEADRRRYHDRWLDGRFDQNQAQFAGQWAQLQSQVQAFQSQLQETRQGMVNFGTMAGVGQSSTSNNVR